MEELSPSLLRLQVDDASHLPHCGEAMRKYYYTLKRARSCLMQKYNNNLNDNSIGDKILKVSTEIQRVETLPEFKQECKCQVPRMASSMC